MSWWEKLDNDVQTTLAGSGKAGAIIVLTLQYAQDWVQWCLGFGAAVFEFWHSYKTNKPMPKRPEYRAAEEEM